MILKSMIMLNINSDNLEEILTRICGEGEQEPLDEDERQTLGLESNPFLATLFFCERWAWLQEPALMASAFIKLLAKAEVGITTSLSSENQTSTRLLCSLADAEFLHWFAKDFCISTLVTLQEEEEEEEDDEQGRRREKASELKMVLLEALSLFALNYQPRHIFERIVADQELLSILLDLLGSGSDTQKPKGKKSPPISDTTSKLEKLAITSNSSSIKSATYTKELTSAKLLTPCFALIILNSCLISDPALRLQVFSAETMRSCLTLLVKLVVGNVHSPGFRDMIWSMVGEWSQPAPTDDNDNGLTVHEISIYAADFALDLLLNSEGVNKFQSQASMILELFIGLRKIGVPPSHLIYSSLPLKMSVYQDVGSKIFDEEADDIFLFFQTHFDAFDVLRTNDLEGVEQLEEMGKKGLEFMNIWKGIVEASLSSANQVTSTSSILDVTREYILEKKLCSTFMERNVTHLLEKCFIQIISETLPSIQSANLLISLLLYLPWLPQQIAKVKGSPQLLLKLETQFVASAHIIFSKSTRNLVSLNNLTKLMNTTQFPWNSWILSFNLSKIAGSTPNFLSPSSHGFLNLCSEFQEVLKANERKYQADILQLQEELERATKKHSIAPVKTPSKPPSTSYNEKVFAVIKETRLKNETHLAMIRELKEQQSISDATTCHLEEECKELDISCKEMRRKIEQHESKVEAMAQEIENLERSCIEKDDFIHNLEADLNEQEQYQEMVAKLAESVNRRGKGGLPGGRNTPARQPLPQTTRQFGASSLQTSGSYTQGRKTSHSLNQTQEKNVPLSVRRDASNRPTPKETPSKDGYDSRPLRNQQQQQEYMSDEDAFGLDEAEENAPAKPVAETFSQLFF